MQIGFIGAGQMGMPMVRRLVGAGHEVTVYARRAEVRDECRALGASATDSAAEAVAGVDAVVTCLYADAQLRELALGPDGFLASTAPGALVLVHTTGSPSTARALAEAGSPRGLHIVDAPVSGSAEDIAAGHVTVMLGGEPDAVARAHAVVSAYGDPVVALGPLGSAQVVKLLNNALFAAQIQLAGEVERIAGRFGVDPPTLASTIQRSSGASYAMSLVETMGSTATLAEAAGHFLHKDVAAVVDVADELGLDLGVLGHVNRHGPVRFSGREG